MGGTTNRAGQWRTMTQHGSRPNGEYRVLARKAEDIVRFIKHAQALGFTLAEIEERVGRGSSPPMTLRWP